MTDNPPDYVRRILAIDPGGQSGYAYGQDGFLESSGTVDGNDLSSMQEIMDEADPDLVVIEDQYFDTGAKRNFKAIKRLMFHRHAWQVLAMQGGYDIAFCMPKSWQGYYKLNRGKGESSREFKDRMVQFAGCVFDRPVEHDESDAVLLFFYFDSYLKLVKPSGEGLGDPNP